MNNIEEQLWDYIDGNCTPDDKAAIATLIASDEAYRLKYQELMALNNEFAAIELDEPPMAFTYNVIEAIRSENAQVPLKAAINKRIIIGIALFFIIALTGFITYALINFNWSAHGLPDVAVKVPVDFKVPQVSSSISKPLLQGFLFFDVVLGLFLFDKWLHRKNSTKQA